MAVNHPGEIVAPSRSTLRRFLIGESGPEFLVERTFTSYMPDQARGASVDDLIDDIDDVLDRYRRDE